ncbi:mevalonate kinase [Enterococcus asini]|uniref:mevalonate kinase n=1 Tax=Enterococcus asini TaxID=57732 RepID=UPI00288ECEBF|nr:mevalonate kinase [Enterococcus asini]MDT2757425.1 mevalonate kinase [Enterococcus asini]
MQVIATGVASGKIILMGEHAVVYGKPAIAMPFAATKITATMQQASQDFLTSNYYSGSLAQAPANLMNLQHLISQLRKDFVAPFVDCQITSTIPAERGMGSSAAVAVAVTRAFLAWQEIPETQELLLKYVNASEKIAHGNPSGIDAAATSGNQPIFFQKELPLEPFELNLTGALIVADTGVKGKTRDTVADVATLLRLQPEKTRSAIDKLGTLTKSARLAISNNQPAVLGQLMNQAQTVLQQLSVSDASLDHLVQVARHNGALGAKLTGGGRGGCMIALARDFAQAKIIANQLENEGAKATWIQELGVCQYV